MSKPKWKEGHPSKGDALPKEWYEWITKAAERCAGIEQDFYRDHRFMAPEILHDLICQRYSDIITETLGSARAYFREGKMPTVKEGG